MANNRDRSGFMSSASSGREGAVIAPRSRWRRRLAALAGAVVMSLGLGTAVQAPQAAAADPTGAFNCNPGYVYASTEKGEIKQIAPSGAVTTPVTAPSTGGGSSTTWTSGTRAWGSGVITQFWGMRVFGIGPGGTTAYALEGGNGKTTDATYGVDVRGKNVSQAYNYDQASALPVKWAALVGATKNPGGNRPLAAGAVKPAGSGQGSLYYGSFEASATPGGSMSFMVSSYKAGLVPSWGSAVTIPLPDFASTAGSGTDDYYAGTRGMEGDIAFDAAGNMYILASTQPKVNPNFPSGASVKVQLITVPNGTNTPIASIAREIEAPGGLTGGAFSGLATSSDGTIYVSDSASVYSYDPVSWQRLGTSAIRVGTAADGQRVSDLASCSASSTLSVSENLPQGRVQPTDQFSVSVQKNGVTGTSLTTAGTATGVQPQKVGPVLVRADEQHVLTQTMPSGDPSLYTTTWSCTNVVGTSSGTGSVATVSVAAGSAASCEFVNVPNLGTMALTKDFTGPNYGAATNPADWTLRMISRSAYIADQGAAWTTFSSGQTRTLGAQSYLIDEVARPGYKLSGVTCKPATGIAENLQLQLIDPTRPALGSAYIWTLENSDAVSCTVHNSVIPGTVSWTKTDGGTTVLGGSEWSLTGPGGTSVTVVDNTGQEGYVGLDTDARPGQFAVINQNWGTYQLVETQAPSGYALTTTTTSLTVNATTPSPSATIGNTALIFHVQKLGYPDPGAANPVPIDGAGYRIYLDDGFGHPADPAPGVEVTPSTTTTGLLDITGIGDGNYWLIETKSAPGHALLPNAVPFTVVSGSTNRPQGALDTPALELSSLSQDRLSIVVRDVRAVELPMAGGGRPPLIYVLVGLAVILAASAAGAWRFRSSHPATASDSSLPNKEMR